MAQEYEVRPDGNGGWRVGPVTTGCGTIVGVIVFVLILALIIKFCDDPPTSDYTPDTQVTDDIAGTDSGEIDLGYIWLTDLSPINSDNLYAYTTNYDTISNVDTELTHCLRTGTMYSGGYGEGWIEYYLGSNDYQYLTGCLAITKDYFDTNYIGKLVIYADGQEIYRVDEMVAGTAPIEFELNISGTERIRIEHNGGAPFRVANVKLWVHAPNN